MTFKLEFKEDGAIHFVGDDVNAKAFASVLGQLIGKVVAETVKLQDGVEMMDVLKELGDEVIIPSFLVGAGCKKMEE